MKNIYLEPNEEIISVVDRLTQAEDDQVSLVAPTGAQIWQSSINLKLLKREADSLNKVVTFIVADDLSAEMAQKIGFIVKKEQEIEKDEIVTEEVVEPEEPKEDMIDFLVNELETDKKEKKTLGVLVSEKRMADIVTPQQEAKPSFFRKPEPEIEPKVFNQISKPTGFRWSKLFTLFIIVTLVIAGLLSFLILPNAQVTITPKTETVNFELSAIGSTGVSQIDQSLNQIPLQKVEVTKTKSGEFNTTGEKEINQKARGYITIYNEYSSEDQTLVATTRFESSDGKIFRIPKSLTVPGAKIEEGRIIASTLKVEIVADQSGQEYNIGPSDFTIPGFKGTAKFAGFYGKSSESMNDGYIGKAKVVLTKDLTEAEDALIEDLKEEVRKSLEEQIPDDLRIVEDGLKEEVSKISSDLKEGDQAEKFNLEIKLTMTALLFKEEDLKDLVDLNLTSKISEDKSPIRETQKIGWSEPEIDWSKGEVSFSLDVEEKVAWQIDIQKLKQDLVGQNEVEVRKYLSSQFEIEKARVSFWPFWVNKIPKQEKKIKVEIEI